MSLRKADKTSDLIDSIINSENGKVQKYLLERKRKEIEFLEEKEKIKKKNLLAPKLNQMFIKNKNNDDKLINETIGLRTVDEYKKIKYEIYNQKKNENIIEDTENDKYKNTKKFNLSCYINDESDENENDESESNYDNEDNKNNKVNNQNNDNKENNDKKNDNEENNDNQNNKDNKDNNIKDNENNNNDKKIVKNKMIFKKVMKDPTVNTSFLKDKERDEEIELKRNQLKQLYYEIENKEKEKMIEITYSYYDGSGHRKKIAVQQKTTIGEFINKCVENLKNDFIQLRSASSDTLIFVKEDLILPNHITFYELIKNKVQGKTGSLFSFDIIQNLNIPSDIRKQKTDAHVAKLVEKKWYEKNKHIFPASKWELYIPSKNYSINYNDLFNN